MKKSLLFLLSFVVLLSSVLMVASATGDDLADDMFDDDENVTYDNGTTYTNDNDNNKYTCYQVNGCNINNGWLLNNNFPEFYKKTGDVKKRHCLHQS
jgi:hypothetical protein